MAAPEDSGSVSTPEQVLPGSGNRLVVRDQGIPALLRGTLADFFQFSSATGSGLAFAKFRSVVDEVEWRQILFFNSAGIEALVARGSGGAWVYVVEVTQPDAVASAARAGGLRPSGRIVSIEAMPDAAPSSDAEEELPGPQGDLFKVRVVVPVSFARMAGERGSDYFTNKGRDALTGNIEHYQRDKTDLVGVLTPGSGVITPIPKEQAMNSRKLEGWAP